MKQYLTTLAIASLISVFLSACVSPPETRTVMNPPPSIIRIKTEQRILSYNKDPRIYYLFAPGEYKLIGEDRGAWYYANESESYRYKYLKPEAVQGGGIAYDKGNGRFYVYWSMGVEELRSRVLDVGGFAAAAAVKSSLGDGKSRDFSTWITDEFSSEWEIVSAETKGGEPGATDNPDDAQRLREDH